MTVTLPAPDRTPDRSDPTASGATPPTTTNAPYPPTPPGPPTPAHRPPDLEATLDASSHSRCSPRSLGQHSVAADDEPGEYPVALRNPVGSIPGPPPTPPRTTPANIDAVDPSLTPAGRNTEERDRNPRRHPRSPQCARTTYGAAIRLNTWPDPTHGRWERNITSLASPPSATALPGNRRPREGHDMPTTIGSLERPATHGWCASGVPPDRAAALRSHAGVDQLITNSQTRWLLDAASAESPKLLAQKRRRRTALCASSGEYCQPAGFQSVRGTSAPVRSLSVHGDQARPSVNAGWAHAECGAAVPSDNTAARPATRLLGATHRQSLRPDSSYRSRNWSLRLLLSSA